MLITSAPASTAAATTSERYPISVRVASIGENATSLQRLLASRTDSPALCRISSWFERIWCSMCRSDVPTKVWMRGLLDHCTASQARSMSAWWMRARPAIVGPFTSVAMRLTDSKSPSELIGYLYLLLHGERDPRRLFAVPERGVKNLYASHIPLFFLRLLCGSKSAADLRW